MRSVMAGPCLPGPGGPRVLLLGDVEALVYRSACGRSRHREPHGCQIADTYLIKSAAVEFLWETRLRQNRPFGDRVSALNQRAAGLRLRGPCPFRPRGAEAFCGTGSGGMKRGM